MQLSRLFLLKDAIFRLTTKIRNRVFPRNLSKRSSSYPFLAPDTYLDFCEKSILSESDLIDFARDSKRFSNFKSIYIAGELVDGLISKVDNLKGIKINKIMIMESDTTQNVENLRNLLVISNKIYSNNLVGNLEKITPIPLGLERRAYRSAGVKNHYRKNFSTSPKNRKIDFLVAWNDETNKKRIEYRNKFKESKKGLVINRRMHPRSIHELMRKTLFVPSPAGNGLDCHRTWEALYLGAIPVVLKSEFWGDSTWPVLVINDWDDLLKLSRVELEDLYSSRSMNKAAAIEFSKTIIGKISNHAS
jgi:hypothetical protein